MNPDLELPNWFRLVAYFEGQCAPEARAEIDRWIQANPEHAETVRHLRVVWHTRRRSTPVTADRAAGIEQVMLAVRASRQPAVRRLVRRTAVSEWRGIRQFAAHPGVRVVAALLRPVGVSGVGSFFEGQDRTTAGMADGVTVRKLFRAWPRRDPGQHSLFRTVGFGVAAGAVFLAASLAIFFVFLARTRSERGAPMAGLAGHPMRELATRRGQRADLRLADGSRVILGVDSKLRISSNFGQAARDVYLDGEAYFEVTHNTTRPFRVHTAQGVATDIGTRFSARAYPEDSGMVVVVAEGKVALGRRALEPGRASVSDSLVLVPGDLGQVRRDGVLAMERGAAVTRYLAWTEGRLVLQGLPVPDALREVERWYDVKIRVTDAALRARHVNISFRDETISEAMRELAAALDVRVERQGRMFTLTPRPEIP